MVSTSISTRTYGRPRAFLRVSGPDAESYLQRMVSNDVEALRPGDSCDALLLTAKARVIAPLRIWRRGDDDFLLLAEPALGEVVRSHLQRFRFAAKAEVEPEAHTSTLVLGEGEGIANADYGVFAREVLDAGEPDGDVEELEWMRIEARTPRFGREIDERILPAEAGLTERAVSFSKGCYPGQEPIARLHYRGKANRGLRVLELDGNEFPEYDAELLHGEKAVGRVTSAARRPDGTIVALAYVRSEVSPDAELSCGETRARQMRPA